MIFKPLLKVKPMKRNRRRRSEASSAATEHAATLEVMTPRTDDDNTAQSGSDATERAATWCYMEVLTTSAFDTASVSPACLNSVCSTACNICVAAANFWILIM